MGRLGWAGYPQGDRGDGAPRGRILLPVCPFGPSALTTASSTSAILCCRRRRGPTSALPTSTAPIRLSWNAAASSALNTAIRPPSPGGASRRTSPQPRRPRPHQEPHLNSNQIGTLAASYTYDMEGCRRLHHLSHPLLRTGSNYQARRPRFTPTTPWHVPPPCLKAPQSIVSSVSYNPAGQITALTTPGHPNPAPTTTAANSPARPVSAWTSVTLFHRQRWQNTGKTRPHLGRKGAYHDQLGRLISAATEGAGGWGLALNHDGFGNLTQQSVTKGSSPASPTPSTEPPTVSSARTTTPTAIDRLHANADLRHRELHPNRLRTPLLNSTSTPVAMSA